MRRTTTALLLALLMPMAAPAMAAQAANPATIATHPVAEQGLTLLMVDLKGCSFCQAWRDQVGPHYAASAPAQLAPLSVVDIDGPWPNGIVLGSRPYITPTFILLDGKTEIARMEGYPGPDQFWAGVTEMLTATGHPLP